MTNDQMDSALHLIQELSEVQKAITKLLMFGERPYFQGVQYDNIEDIRNELEDVYKRAEEFWLFWS